MRKLKLEELNRISPEEYHSSSKLPIVVVLDNIRSALNVGSVFRTVDGFGLERIVLCGISAQPPHREIHKTAIGATETVTWSYINSAAEALHQLQADGYIVILAEQTDQSVPLDQLEVNSSDKIAVVFGNEVDGVSDDVMHSGYTAVEIPQFGTKHSFNVAVSAGIVLWEVQQKLRG